MKTFPEFDVIGPDALRPGEIVGVMSIHGLTFGLSVVDPKESTDATAIAVFEPRKSGLRPSESAAKSLVRFTDVRVAVDFSASAVFASDGLGSRGHVALCDGSLGVFASIARRPHSLHRFDDGREMTPKFGITFPRWSIESRDEDGSWKTLAAFDFTEKE